ncbi:hypothetical protein OSB04_022726 [Centaurea solstitialis]|uniref:Uncharacterized protein n=1 Tax=Centaurea solstitialis TaxID=347529 RepID=A0AA38WAC4_9ASTR|nr:hypothetical protein OSB04_022726 [Centaurea solstitialis]
MDTKTQLGAADKNSCKSVDRLDKNSCDMETKDVPHLSSPPSIVANNDLSLSPITPDSNKENADLMSNFTSPLTLVASPPTTVGFCSQPDQSESGDDSDMKVDDEIDSPCTPKEGVFDPFAPGPDKLMLAPICTKYLEESRSFVARRLNFSSAMTKKDCEKEGCESGFEDDMLLEAVYESLLEAIICKQAEDIVATVDSCCPSSPETPPCAPLLTGIAETCPGAPMKAVKKSRNIEMSLCRKLEFEF